MDWKWKFLPKTFRFTLPNPWDKWEKLGTAGKIAPCVKFCPGWGNPCGQNQKSWCYFARMTIKSARLRLLFRSYVNHAWAKFCYVRLYAQNELSDFEFFSFHFFQHISSHFWNVCHQVHNAARAQPRLVAAPLCISKCISVYLCVFLCISVYF